MKTLLAAIALSVATATAASAGYVDAKDGGIPLVATAAGYDAAQVSGFTGVSSGEFHGYVDAKDGGAPLAVRWQNHGQVSGFTGIAAGSDFHGYVDASDGGRPLVR
ncbi:MAG: hypothetical protein KDJ80_04000 [Nitratireductor sp.]|nr:hypothetical protein [Nitratireductor sp.]